MPTTAGLSAAGLATLLLVGGIAASTASLDATEDLEATLQAVLDSAMRDISVGWLEVQDARGQVQDGQVVALDLLVRLDGGTRSLALDELVWRAQDGTLLHLNATTAVRDADGSLSNGTLEDRDLANLALVPEHPIEPDRRLTLSAHHPDKARLEVVLEIPRTLTDGSHRFPVTRSW